MSEQLPSNPQDGLLDRVRRRLAPDAEILVNEGPICVGDDWDEVRDYLSLLQLADDMLDERQRHLNEIERLRDQVTDLQIANGMKAGEIERLRAENERLLHYADTCGGSDNDGRCPMKHLLRATDETSAVPGCAPGPNLNIKVEEL